MEIAFKYIKDLGKISFQVKSLAPHENPTSIINFTIRHCMPYDIACAMHSLYLYINLSYSL